jgi:hypothetical protein
MSGVTPVRALKNHQREQEALREWASGWSRVVRQISYVYLPFQREEDRNSYEMWCLHLEDGEDPDGLSLEELNDLYAEQTIGCESLPPFACILWAPVHPDLGYFSDPPCDCADEYAWHRAAHDNARFYIGHPEFSSEQDRLRSFDGPYETIEAAMAKFQPPGVRILQMC